MRKGVSVSKLAVLLIVPAVALAAAGCGGSNKSSSGSTTASASPSAPSTGGVKISSSTIARLGPALVDAQGRTLYVFAPDKGKKVTCVSTCAQIWPPAFVPSGKQAVAAAPVKQSLLGSDPDPAGGRVITYAGWPLYTYVTDTAPGQATGQAVNLNGGPWYVISPAGKVITKKP
jgi:predicted lipoprotein with Yx(FWY)xxD motif